MSAIVPNPEEFQKFVASPDDGPVVMINLLKFAAQAGGGSATGREAYERYADGATRMIEQQGGRVAWIGRPEHVLIGDASRDRWDLVALVEYPNRRAFIQMVSSAEYQKIHVHREQGLESTVLIACKPGLEQQ
jgi:uncharacterized protein (DUF1330 family)